ncbi:cytidine deaminase family protein [Micavibrio aeruginosavorus]|nr:cytidine deaminase [Micavibrio aeruginosavorus]
MDFVRSFHTLDEKTIMPWLRDVRMQAYAPASGYRVGAVLIVKTATGFLGFAGVNVESIEHRLSIHGEEGALSALVTTLGPDVAIESAWVIGGVDDHGSESDMVAHCCGNCRQQLAGLARTPDIRVRNCALSGRVVDTALNDLLPDSFSFDNFNAESSALRSRAIETITPDQDVNDLARRAVRNEPHDIPALRAWAGELKSLNYASHTSQTVILALDNGTYVAGVKIENAVFTGLSAMQAALAIANVSQKPGWSVTEAFVFSERGGDAGALRGDEIMPLSLSALQILNEFSKSSIIPLTHLCANGDGMTMTLADWGAEAPRMHHETRRIRNGLLLSAA